MEHEAVQRRASATIKNMGVNTYSQIISAFRAQGDLTEDQLNIFPVLQNALGIGRERHTAEIKRALYDEQLSSIATSLDPMAETTNWEIEADYNCASIVHRPPDSECVRFAERVLQTTPPTMIIQPSFSAGRTRLNHDLQQLVHDERNYDGVINATQQQQAVPQGLTVAKPAGINPDRSGSKVACAKPGAKRNASLDTLIEVVQKELRRAQEQSHAAVPSLHLQNRMPQSPFTSSVLPSSHPASFTSQSNHSFKMSRKRGTLNLRAVKRLSSTSQRNLSLHNDGDGEYEPMDTDDMDDAQFGPENIDEVVRETVDQLVAIASGAPDGIGESKVLPRTSSPYGAPLGKMHSTMYRTDYRHETTTMSTITDDFRHSMQQTSPMKPPQPVPSPAQHIQHPQLIIQPASTAPISSLQGTTTPTLLVAPRILNFQTVVPRAPTPIQIGNTKIILVSPSNITQHLPHSTTVNPPMAASAAQQQSPVKLVKFTTANNTNSVNPLATRTTTLPIGATQASALTLPKNVQIVIPSQTPSTIQLTRAHNDDANKSLATATTFRSMATMPMALAACAVDPIPQAAQEVTVSGSPTSPPPSLMVNVANHSSQTSLASISDSSAPSAAVQQQTTVLNVTAARASPTSDEMIKSVAVNFQPHQPQIQRPPSTHGPMIYRMTSVNPNVPVFRVRATTAPTSATVINKSIKPDVKPISVTTASNMCYEPKPAHNPSTPGGSVSVLACFKTTKKRNKERAIMPRPSASDMNESAGDMLQQRSQTPAGSNASIVLTSDVASVISSPDYRPQTSLTPTRLVQQTSLSSALSDELSPSILPSLPQDQTNDAAASSTNGNPLARIIPVESSSVK